MLLVSSTLVSPTVCRPSRDTPAALTRSDPKRHARSRSQTQPPRQQNSLASDGKALTNGCPPTCSLTCRRVCGLSELDTAAEGLATCAGVEAEVAAGGVLVPNAPARAAFSAAALAARSRLSAYLFSSCFSYPLSCKAHRCLPCPSRHQSQLRLCAGKATWQVVTKQHTSICALIAAFARASSSFSLRLRSRSRWISLACMSSLICPASWPALRRSAFLIRQLIYSPPINSIHILPYLAISQSAR